MSQNDTGRSCEEAIVSHGGAKMPCCEAMALAANDLGREEALYCSLLAQQKDSAHPERYVLGKPHPDRARQFKPFAALRGYEELIARVIEDANEPCDFAGLEESC